MLSQTGSFVNHLVRSFLNRAESRSYVVKLFGYTLTKLHDFTALPSDIKRGLLTNLMADDVNFSRSQTIAPFLKPLNKETIEPMKAYEAMAFSEALLTNIVESLAFLPRSVRCLIKTVEQHAAERLGKNEKARARKVVVDFLFSFWWTPMLAEGNSSGVLKNPKSDSTFCNCAYTVLELLRTVFYQKCTSSAFPPCVHKFVESKRQIVNEYLDKLLAFEMPKEQRHVDKLLPIDKILCLSLESICLLYKISKENMEYLGETHSSFSKYIARVKDFLKGEGKKKLADPCSDFFKELPIANAGEPQKPAKGKKNKVHYIVFHEINSLVKTTRLCENYSADFEESWKNYLCELLMRVNLKQYYALLDSARITSSSPLKDLLEAIKEDPELFLISETQNVRTKLLSDLLMNSLKPETTQSPIHELINFYKEEMDNARLKNKNLKKVMQGIANTTKKRYSKVREGNVEYEKEIIPLLVAEALIGSKTSFAFSVEQITTGKITKEGSSGRFKKTY